MGLLRWYPRIAEKRNELSGSVGKIATVGFGAGIVQVVTVALTPIITRLYSPDAFGGYALYWSVAAFFISVSALRYETAIVLAKLLGITDTSFSEVMHGKRKVNMELAKRLYKTLGVDPKFILEKS